MFQFIMGLDKEILIWIQDMLRNDMLTPAMTFITKLGDGGAIWILLSVALLIPKKTRMTGFMMLLSLGITFIIDNIFLKNIVARIRPYDAILELECLVERQKDFSFPSGHSGSAFATAVVMLLRLPKKYGIPAIILALLISFSRLYVGVHYLTDVLVGAIIGTIIALIVYRVCMFISGRKSAS